MSKIAYTPKKFTAATMEIIDRAETIMNQYAADGYVLTVRQLYYQFVARDLIPNTQKDYKRLASIISDARLAGLLDWDTIEDRTRALAGLSTWRSPADIMESASRGYRTDLWAGMEWRPEVWIEKEALEGVVERVCNAERVDYLSCRGYASQSVVYTAAHRIINRYRYKKQRTVILHFGDHDPSGIDMTRDNRERLEIMCYYHLGMSPVKVVRVALNMGQVEQYDPPPNPAKADDPRFVYYRDEYGDDSWELDALDPNVISALVNEHVEKYRDAEKWNENAEAEENDRDDLEKVRQNWEDVKSFVRDNF